MASLLETVGQFHEEVQEAEAQKSDSGDADADAAAEGQGQLGQQQQSDATDEAADGENGDESEEKWGKGWGEPVQQHSWSCGSLVSAFELCCFQSSKRNGYSNIHMRRYACVQTYTCLYIYVYVYICIYIYIIYIIYIYICSDDPKWGDWAQPPGQKLMKKLSEELGPVADAINAADSAFGAGAGQGMVDGMEGDGFGLAQGQWHQSLSDDQNEDWMMGWCDSHSWGNGGLKDAFHCWEFQQLFPFCEKCEAICPTSFAILEIPSMLDWLKGIYFKKT